MLLLVHCYRFYIVYYMWCISSLKTYAYFTTVHLTTCRVFTASTWQVWCSNGSRRRAVSMFERSWILRNHRPFTTPLINQTASTCKCSRWALSQPFGFNFTVGVRYCLVFEKAARQLLCKITASSACVSIGHRWRSPAAAAWTFLYAWAEPMATRLLKNAFLMTPASRA